MSEHRHPDHSTHHDLDWDSPTTAARTELEGEVLAGLVERALAVLGDLCGAGSLNVSRILDLGCGPGVFTCLLAQRFGSATVLAVDGSAEMLDRATARVRRLALEQRVQTRLLELPAGLDSLDQADVIWASMVLHHVGDEAAALRQVRRLLNPGGLLAVVEHGGELRVLPADTDLGRPGLWERLDAAGEEWFGDMRADLPESIESGSYADMLRLAGFGVLADELLTLTLDPPLDDRARRFAHDYLLRTRTQLEPYADSADLEALDVLVDDRASESILRRDDALLSASRRFYVAAASVLDE
jgi:SAM-dependent methyltransferase